MEVEESQHLATDAAPPRGVAEQVVFAGGRDEGDGGSGGAQQGGGAHRPGVGRVGVAGAVEDQHWGHGLVEPGAGRDAPVEGGVGGGQAVLGGHGAGLRGVGARPTVEVIHRVGAGRREQHIGADAGVER